ncbi:MOSC domain-containing protein [Tamlana sp. 2_MG-2023]|uniref:MOSC domain-containing protein n=1 Tax=unclassified Tamlana TaxID=2614803 RepID=UPI0026E3ABE6|nr:MULTISPECIES: MOSC domain-containing protein [unclassified Tamlana]MDO6760149.1 MOSC domain-containing protein [Tamlana sp. 2_MG-2023]MDO6790153.1 MOSC domain-containing protein [Tamlana sp. 1_MG-2023]
MKIISTNTSKPKTIIWNDKPVVTGIYKTPTSAPIYLGKSDVENDTVTDRKYHGGEFKACYLFSEDHYAYWKTLYPNLEWNWGMFGENLTVAGLDETKIHVGDIYSVGNARIQITEHREPCFKLGVKFGTQNVLKQFINHGFPGTYIRVLNEGTAQSGDTFKLIEQAENSLTTTALFKLIFDKEKNQDHLKRAVSNEALPIKLRNDLKKHLK